MDDTISYSRSGQSIKRTKSKTVIKKSRYSNLKCNNSITVSTISNLKKRKLDEHNADANNNNKTEPHRKKRKLNALIELLKKQNYELKQEINELRKEKNNYKQRFDIYKKEANKWKTQYIKLCSHLRQLSNEKIPIIENECSCEIEIEINQTDDNESSSPTHPPSKCFHKPTNKTINDEDNNPSNHTSISRVRKKPRSLYKNNIQSNNVITGNNSSNNTKYNATSNSKSRQLPSTMTNMGRTNTRRKNSSRKKLCNDIYNDEEDQSAVFNDNNRDFVQFEDSYYISVNCHICQAHFDNIFIYKNHLKTHYNIDPTKTWKQCDLGCNYKAEREMHFIRHISTHTLDKPYKCKVTINGSKCKVIRGYKPDLKQHWKSHFGIKTQRKKVLRVKHNSEHIEFEDSYHVSVHCHICQQHFDVIDTYINHMKTHYNNDPNKTWKKCDFECETNTLFSSDVTFISHIAQHRKTEKPLKCDVVIKGFKCQSSFGGKKNLKDHWKKHYTKQNANKKSKKCDTEKSIKKDNDFENSYYISVNCHICKQHFDDIYQYEHHIKQHYDKNAGKTWLRCDFGCEDKQLLCSRDFIRHIASHTKSYPYKCNIMDGSRCKGKGNAGYGTKGDFKRHWKSCHSKNINKHSSQSDYDSSSSQSLSESGSDYDYNAEYPPNVTFVTTRKTGNNFIVDHNNY